MRLKRCGRAVIVQAPAKLNLFLEVVSQRADGYHELETLMVASTIEDTLLFTSDSSGGLQLECGWSPGCEAQRWVSDEGSPWETLPSDRDNLVVRAIQRLRDCAHVQMGAKIVLQKRIPLAAGLGGASSDAAAALVAANLAWGMPIEPSQLVAIGSQLGSDVPFFFCSGAAICRGRGELVETLPLIPTFHFVVVKPPAGLSTADVYRACQPAQAPRDSSRILAAIRSGNPLQLGRALHNRLQEAALQLSPWVRRLRDVFQRLDFLGHQLSGSGTSYFGVCQHALHARRLAARLRAMRLGAVFTVHTQRSADYGTT